MPDLIVLIMEIANLFQMVNLQVGLTRGFYCHGHMVLLRKYANPYMTLELNPLIRGVNQP
jgi:hypothetical protein